MKMGMILQWIFADNSIVSMMFPEFIGIVREGGRGVQREGGT